MKNNQFRIFFTIGLVSFLLIGCAGGIQNDPSLPVVNDVEEIQPSQTETKEDDSPVEEVSLATERDAEPAKFSIKADPGLQEVIAGLYGRFFEGEVPLFVDENPDLIATGASATPEERPHVQPTFLPDAVLISETDNIDVNNFISFAISPDGQQVLIDMGALPETISLIDQAGNQVEFQQPIRRVISAYGPASAIVYTVNGLDRLVSAAYLGARDSQGAAAMERIDPRFLDLVGDAYFSQQEFNLEQAATLEPDLIIGSFRSAWIDTVKELGVPLFMVEAETPQQLRDAVLMTGQIFGPNSQAQAKAWVDYYDWLIESIQGQLTGILPVEKPRVLFTGTESLRVVSGDMYQTNMINAAGGTSASAELSGYWNNINIEQVAVWNPELIIVPPYGGASVEAITESPEWQIIDAVMQGQVFLMPKLVVPWDTPAPDSVLGIVWMAELIHPDRVELSCAVETEFFYNTFYSYGISKGEITAICTHE
ncbi:MAG: ABC transporter substrate-binding protein [Anaerolineaceae bacterium]